MFTYTRKTHYHETDQMGMIHHANYVKWMEEARVAFMDAIGFGYQKVEENGIVSPVTVLTLDYKKAVYFDDVVAISITVEKYSGVVLKLRYSFYNETKNELCSQATSTHCFLRDGRIVSLKKTLPALDAAIRACPEAKTV